MSAGLGTVLSQLAVSVPVAQKRLDAFHHAALLACRDALRAVQGTPAEPAARELVPARLIAHQTDIEVAMQMSKIVEEGILVTLKNEYYSRRYARQRTGSASIRITLHSTPIPMDEKGTAR